MRQTVTINIGGKRRKQPKKESTMPLIYVRAKPGRVALDRARHGHMISNTEFVPVEDSPHIQRLLHHFGDIELEPVRTKAPAAKVEEEPLAIPVAPVAKDK